MTKVALKSLGVLCARGASKRLPRKHLQTLGGLPLVAWMCRAAAASSLTRVILTSEDLEIAAVARAHGVEVPFRRDARLAEDYAADYEIVVDALDRAEAENNVRYDVVVMLQPTTPFVQPADIDGCIDRLNSDAQLATCFTARPVSEPPQWMFTEGGDGRATPLMNGIGSNEVAHKQGLAKYWIPSGAAYAIRTEAFRRQKQIYCTPYALQQMERDRAVDIDEAADLVFAESLAKARGFIPAAAGTKRLTANGETQ